MLFSGWCMCVCVCVCMGVNTIASKRCIRLSSNLVCMLQVAVGRTLLISVNIGCIVFLQEYKKEFWYITAYGVNSFKCSSIQIVHSIELKFGMHAIDHRRTNLIDFGECRTYSFLQECKNKFLYITAYEVKFFKVF